MIRERRQRAIYVVTDLVSTNVALLVYNVMRWQMIHAGAVGGVFPTLGSFLGSRTLVIEQIVFPLVMLAIYALSGYYNNVFIKSRLQELMGTLTSSLIGTLLLFFTVLVNDTSMADHAWAFHLMIPLFLSLSVIVYIPRYLITRISARNIASGHWGFNTLIIGTSQTAINFERRLRTTRNQMGLRVAGFVETGTARVTDPDRYCKPVFPIDDIASVIDRLDIKRLIVVPHRNGMRATTELINSLFKLNLPIYITPDVFQLITARPRMTNVASEPLVDITRSNMDPSTQNLKRLSDVVVSAFTLIVIAPVLAVLAAAIKLDSPGPVFYKQERLGLHKQPFFIYKLRSMTVDAESTGPALSTVEDPRITRLGRFLRKYRLDELPQFWNVLRGDMSLVGPRPEREYYVRRIVERAPHYTIIQQVRPGITSWGMVKYGYASTVDEMLERLPYDIMYIENVSFVIDIKIIIYTIRTVLTGKGI